LEVANRYAKAYVNQTQSKNLKLVGREPSSFERNNLKNFRRSISCINPIPKKQVNSHDFAISWQKTIAG